MPRQWWLLVRRRRIMSRQEGSSRLASSTVGMVRSVYYEVSRQHFHYRQALEEQCYLCPLREGVTNILAHLVATPSSRSSSLSSWRSPPQLSLLTRPRHPSPRFVARVQRSTHRCLSPPLMCASVCTLCRTVSRRSPNEKTRGMVRRRGRTHAYSSAWHQELR